ncbi:MAG: tripartite tricarboxylate transporter substrate-binding protein, partial [Pseudomonadota bacterium]
MLCIFNAWGQTTPTYPNKVVRIVNPVAAGGNQDMIARVYAEHMTRVFGQPVVVESRPGASAIVGTRFVKSAAPDGYTLLA